MFRGLTGCSNSSTGWQADRHRVFFVRKPPSWRQGWAAVGVGTWAMTKRYIYIARHEYSLERGWSWCIWHTHMYKYIYICMYDCIMYGKIYKYKICMQQYMYIFLWEARAPTRWSVEFSSVKGFSLPTSVGHLQLLPALSTSHRVSTGWVPGETQLFCSSSHGWDCCLCLV